jgi:diguanylate cyclase (GGDEF)-like protein
MSDYISRILIVDDIEANLIALKAILKSKSAQIFAADSGNEALKILLEEQIDIVLLDVQMPNMNGFEVAELMRSNTRTKDIPIIFVTAINKEEKYIFRGYELGAVDYIYKPVNNEILKSKVHVFIRLNEQKRIIEEKTKALKEKIELLEIAEKKLSQLARIDDLTGSLNRRGFEEEFHREWSRSILYRSFFSLIMIDIDDFKKYNDTYGHVEGDQCLIQVAKSIEKSLRRPFDEVARYGGEEFVVLLPDTNQNGVLRVAENIRASIEALKINNSDAPEAWYVTVSLGVVTTIPQIDQDKEELLRRADQALYQAKDNGKNQIGIASFDA